MNRRALLAFVATAGCACSLVPAEPGSAATREISALIAAQSAAWNRGDIEGFMQGYAPTDDLRFASGGSITRGWKPTLERYQQRYPDKSAMGTLAFTEIEITELAPDAAIAFGHWRLTRAKDAPQGLFTLTLKRSAAGWRIIHDHTSSAP